MPGKAYQRIFELAAEQHGYVTTAQAAAAGVRRHAILMMARRGDMEPISHGVYRVAAFPRGPLDEYMAATLWPYGATGVLSHDTALDLYELSDVNPAKIHLTVPTTFRIRRSIPNIYVLHHADFTPDETTVLEGLPITTPVRTIRDCHARHLGPALIRQAIEGGRRKGILKMDEADLLTHDLLADPTTSMRGAQCPQPIQGVVLSLCSDHSHKHQPM